MAPKREVSVTVKMEASDWEEFQRCASVMWPGADITKSRLLLSLAKIGVEHCYREKGHTHKAK